jgi:hypothetical protein
MIMSTLQGSFVNFIFASDYELIGDKRARGRRLTPSSSPIGLLYRPFSSSCISGIDMSGELQLDLPYRDRFKEPYGRGKAEQRLFPWISDYLTLALSVKAGVQGSREEVTPEELYLVAFPSDIYTGWSY